MESITNGSSDEGELPDIPTPRTNERILVNTFTSIFYEDLNKKDEMMTGSDRTELSTNYSSDSGDCEPLISTSNFDLNGDVEDEAVKHENFSFSRLEYFSFFAVGLSMMWTWSMILQAVPYFQRRFMTSAFILQYFQAFNLIVFAVAILSTTLVLGVIPGIPSYSRRLKVALVAYVVVATLLTLSTMGGVKMTPLLYFIFTLSMVFVTAVANGLSQNSAFAFVAGFGRTEYAPAIMTGEALAALLPSVIEISTALAFPAEYFKMKDTTRHRTSSSILFYFASAAIVGGSSLCALSFLERRSHSNQFPRKTEMTSDRRRIWKSLKWPALANFSCLCISAVSPVFAAKITSVTPIEDAPILLRPEAFIPLAIVLWNIGDLAGSVLSVTSQFLVRRPCWIFILSVSRIGFIPLYLLCNIDGKGSFAGDWFYLIVVQLLFGLSHGWLSGVSMMGVSVWVGKEDREEGGAFMGMVLVAGLVAGSAVGLVAARA